MKLRINHLNQMVLAGHARTMRITSRLLRNSVLGAQLIAGLTSELPTTRRVEFVWEKAKCATEVYPGRAIAKLCDLAVVWLTRYEVRHDAYSEDAPNARKKII